MDKRENTIKHFLESNNFGSALRNRMPGDASTRGYERLTLDRKNYILMDAPSIETPVCTPDMSVEQRRAAGDNAMRRLAASRVDAFVCLTDYLQSQGFSVPAVHAADCDNGLAILEDFGDGQYWSLLEKTSTADEIAMYEAATDVLIKMDQIVPPTVVLSDNVIWSLLTYDRLAMQTEANLLPEWYAGHHNGVAINEKAIATYQSAWEEVLEVFNDAPQRLIMRDYHSPNLMWLPEREGYQRAGLLDYQDTVLGHPAYNMMFLLNDARRDVAQDLQDKMLERYFTGINADAAERDQYMAAYAAYQALNNMRICGIFCRLNYRDSKSGYMKHLSRVERYVAQSLQHPACARLADWFARYLPHTLIKAA